jgi:hypothetical protein
VSAPPAPNVVMTEEPAPRAIFDTGPIVELARSAAARTVRSVRRRPPERVPEAV